MIENPFYRLAPFIQEYIYRKNWTELRAIQVSACNAIFDTDKNLLLSSGTASGKTEAAFLPILTEIMNKPCKSIAVLYLSPLKALINDQFFRLNELIEEVNIPVYRWHGDVNASEKRKIYKNPQGIMQITPESLESMLMNRHEEIHLFFSDLRYIIIDEVHAFMGTDRGIQLLSLLERIQRIVKLIPRRIGLSATLGDYTAVEKWLSSGTNKETLTPKYVNNNHKIRLALEHFKVELNDEDKGEEIIKSFYNFIYEYSYRKRCIIFGTSRAEIELVISNIKDIARTYGTDDLYLVHHGSISASLRNEAEKTMKYSELPIVIGATTTLELGIDIGSLERVIQLNTPMSVSRFVQRLGRTGRRGNPSEMWFACLEQVNNNTGDLITNIDWDFIETLAIIQLYIEDKWIEPIKVSNYPFGILYHQTMSIVYEKKELSPPKLAELVLSLSTFKNISQIDYKELLNLMIATEHLELTERKTLIIGLVGERIVNNYNFYSVFESTKDDFLVKCESKEIGTIQVSYSIGQQFVLAGQTWVVTDYDKTSKIIYVMKVDEKSNIRWITHGNREVHTKIIKKVKDVLLSDKVYEYLLPNAKRRLIDIRYLIKKEDILDKTVIQISSNEYCILPWLGTNAFKTFTLILKYLYTDIIGIKKTEKDIAIYIETNISIVKIYDILENIKKTNINSSLLINEDDGVNFEGKYNNFIPKKLLLKQFIDEFIDIDDIKKNFILN